MIRPVIAVQPPQSGDLFDEGQAAQYLHQKPRTLRIWRRFRGLPHIKPTQKSVLYRRSDLDTWLEHFRISTRCTPRATVRKSPQP